jgi:hypothetical protein
LEEALRPRPLLAALAALLLEGCASAPRTFPAGQALLGRTPSSPDWSAASVRARYQVHWVTPRAQALFYADLRTLGSMGRADLTLPSGVAVASITWQGDHWQEFLPYQSTLVEGQGESAPLSPLGIPAFPLLELERLSRGLVIPPDAAQRKLSTLYSGKGMRVLLSDPDSRAHRWALHLSESDGFVRRIQRFQGPVQEEDLQIQSYLPRVPVPSRLRREFDTTTFLDLELQGWSDRNFVSPTELLLPFDPQMDTISIGTDHSGKRYYTLRSSHPDSVLPFPKDFLSEVALSPDTSFEDAEDSAEDSALVDSSAEGNENGPDLEEDDLEEDDSLPASPSKEAPSLPAVLKPRGGAPLDTPTPPPASDLPSAPPPTESVLRKF